MAKDQFGLVKCGEIIRIMKLWLREVRKESFTFWELAADNGIRFLKSVKQSMDRALLALDSSARTIKILPDDMKTATQLIESNQYEHSARSEHIDHELHYQVKIGIGVSGVQPSDLVKTGERIKFRLGFHPADEEPSLLTAQDPLTGSDEMGLVIDFGLKQEVSGKCGVMCLEASVAVQHSDHDVRDYKMKKPWTSHLL